jgi:hypothetical protein
MEMIEPSTKYWAMLAAGLTALITVGCSGAKVTTKSSAELPRYRVRTLALVPFTSITTPQVRDQDPYFFKPQSVRGSEMSYSIPSNVEPPPQQTVIVPGYAAEKVTQLFWKRLQTREGVEVFPPGDSTKALSLDENLARATPETAAATVAKRLKADAALIGLVSVFQERVGGRFGADPPASVGFEVRAVAVDGQVLWVGNYYERQRPMTEDFLGFLQRWGMFVTAEELARFGVDEMMKEFPFGAGGE